MPRALITCRCMRGQQAVQHHPAVLFVLILSTATLPVLTKETARKQCLGLPDGNVHLLPNWANDHVMMFTSKGGDKLAKEMFVETEGLPHPEKEHSRYTHKYERDVFLHHHSRAQMEALHIVQVCRKPKAVCLHTVRNPLDRIVASYIQTTKQWTFLPAHNKHDCKKEPCKLRKGNVENCCTSTKFDNNFSFRYFVEVLSRIATGGYASEKTHPSAAGGCNDNTGGLRCAAVQLLELVRKHTSEHWLPQQSTILRTVQRSNVPIIYLPIECIGEDVLEAIDVTFNYKLSKPAYANATLAGKFNLSTNSFEDYSNWFSSDKLLDGKVEDRPLKDILKTKPMYELFMENPETARQICCLYVDDFLLYKQACKQEWLRKKGPKCALACDRELNRIDAICGSTLEAMHEGLPSTWS